MSEDFECGDAAQSRSCARLEPKRDSGKVRVAGEL